MTEENRFDPSKHKLGDVIDTKQDGTPIHSDAILVVDANVLRRLAHPITDERLLENIQPEKLITGQYLDLLLWAGQADNTRVVMVPDVVEYEATRRISGLLIDIGERYPSQDRLAEFFTHVRHVDLEQELEPADAKRPETDFFPSRIEVFERPQGIEYLREVKALFEMAAATGELDEYRASIARGEVDERGRPGKYGEFLELLLHKFDVGLDLGEREVGEYLVKSRKKVGPVYFVTADVRAHRFTGDKITPQGSAIGHVGPAGLIAAMAFSGYMQDNILVPDAKTPPEEVYGLMRKDINSQCKAEDGTNMAIVRSRDLRDQPGTFKFLDEDGQEQDVSGLTLRDRFAGKALHIPFDRLVPSKFIKDVTRHERMDLPPDIDRGI